MVIRLAFVLGGAGMFGWSVFGESFRGDDGALDGTYSLPLAIGLAFILLGCTARTHWDRFGRWAALSLVSHGLALQLIDAGRYLHYQHYRPASVLASFLGGSGRNGGTQPPLTTLEFICIIGIILQAFIVLGACWRRRSGIAEFIGRHLGSLKCVSALIVLSMLSAPVSRDVIMYIVELAIASVIQVVAVLNILLAAIAIQASGPTRLKMFLRRLSRNNAIQRVANCRFDGILILSALWVAVVSATLNVVSYERHPHVMDELIYLNHARILSAGAFTMPAPPVQDAFDLYLMQFDGDRWYATTPIGWPAILAVGVLARTPWLVNPLLAGINVLLAGVLVQHLYRRSTARYVVLLLAASPWYLFIGMSYMTHMASLATALLAVLGVRRAMMTRSPGWALMGGASLGTLSLIRPLEGLMLAGLLGCWALGLGGRRLSGPSLVCFLIGTIVVGGLVFPYNDHLTGSGLGFPIVKYNDEVYGAGSNALGFGDNRGYGWALDPYPGHHLPDVAVNTNLNCFQLNVELFGWSTGSLILIICLCFFGRFRQSDRIMITAVLAVIAIHALYWFSGGPDFGARYWFLMIVPCAVLTVRGGEALVARLSSSPSAAVDASTRIGIAASCLCASSLLVFVPWRAVDKYYHYLNMRPDVRQLSKEHHFGRSIVVVRGDAHPDYASAAAYNALDFDFDGPIYARDRGADSMSRLFAAYADRPIWFIDGPSVTGRGFRVLEGPLTHSDAIAAGIDPAVED